MSKKNPKSKDRKEGETVGLQYNGRDDGRTGGNRKDFYHTAWVMRTQRRYNGVAGMCIFLPHPHL